MKHLKDKYGTTALVTGASSGIGKAFAEKLAEAGLNLVLVARREPLLNELREELVSRHGVDVLVIAADLTEATAPSIVEQKVVEAGIDIDILINNAGFGVYGRFGQSELSRELSMVALNCRAVVDLTYRFLPGMTGRGRGAIVIIASALAFVPSPLLAVYSATKAFDLLFGESLYGELRGTGVDVIAVSPGLTDTGFERASGAGRLHYMRRKPEDVVRTTLAALGKQASVVDGPMNKLGLYAVRPLPRTWVLTINQKLLSRSAQEGRS